MLVLRLLKSKAKYGYQIIQEMKEKSEETFLLKDGTLYPILYRLEEQIFQQGASRNRHERNHRAIRCRRLQFLIGESDSSEASPVECRNNG